MQKMTKGPDGTFPYKSLGDCAIKTLTTEGPLKFYTGFPTYYVRIAPHVMVRGGAGPDLIALTPPPLVPSSSLGFAHIFNAPAPLGACPFPSLPPFPQITLIAQEYLLKLQTENGW